MDISLYPRVSVAFQTLGAQFPELLATNFERILQRIELFWGEKEAIEYIDSLLLNPISDDPTKIGDSISRMRQGFSNEVLNEIVLIKQVHQLQYPSRNFNPYDPFSGTEIVPIEMSAKLERKSAQAEPIRKRNIDWPVLRTQLDLNQYARLNDSGSQVYPLQGKKIGEILMSYGVIYDDALRIVLKMQQKPANVNRPIGEIFVEVGIITEDELSRALFIQTGTLMVDILSIDIPVGISKIVSYSQAREKLAVPIGIFRNALYLAVADPFMFKDHSFFAVMTGMKIKLVYAPMHEIITRLRSHF